MVLDAAGNRRRKHAEPRGRLRSSRADRALAVRDRGQRDGRRARGTGLRPGRSWRPRARRGRWIDRLLGSSPADARIRGDVRPLPGWRLPDRGPGSQDGDGDSTGQPARAGSRPAGQRGGRLPALWGTMRRGRLRDRDHLRRRVRRGGVSGRGDRSRGGDLDGGARGAGREAAGGGAGRAPRRARRSDRQDDPGESSVGDRLRLRRGDRRDREPRAARARRRGEVRRHGRPCCSDRSLTAR